MRARHTLLTLAILCVGAKACAEVVAGQRAYERGDYMAAFAEWQVSAREGNPEAQFRLGKLYREGKGVQQDMLEFSYGGGRRHNMAIAKPQRISGGRLLLDALLV